MRESLTSSAQASQLGSTCTADSGAASEPTRTPPCGRGPVSAVITSAIAPDTVQWPQGYSGKLGVGSSGTQARSEERRVGKECRSRGSQYHEKNKKMLLS